MSRFVQPADGVVALKRGERAAARRGAPERVIHKVADANVARISVALRYAFARGRRALGASKLDVDAAVSAVRDALLEVLPGTLLRVVREGGRAAAEALGSLRAAEFDPEQPRDERGQWTASASLSRVSVEDMGSDYKTHPDDEERPFNVVIRSREGRIQLFRTEERVAIDDVFVPKTLRGKGYGKGLYEEALRYAVSKGMKGLMSVGTMSPAARRVWESFKKEGRVEENEDGDLILLPKVRAAEFDPDQPRDESGRWVSGGGTTALSKLAGKSLFYEVNKSNHVFDHLSEKDRVAYLEDFKQVPEARKAIGRTREMSLDGIVATQKSIEVSQVKELIEDPSLAEDPEDGPPLLLKWHDRILIGDGHHRLAAAKLRGERRAEVEFVDLDAYLRGVRSAEYNEDQPRDESGRWTSVGGLLHDRGERVVAMHGTPDPNLTVEDLDPGAAIEVGGAVFFTSDEDTAWQYTFEREYGETVGESSENVLRSHLEMTDPMVVDMDGEVGEAIRLGELVREAKEKGHDGLILENIDDTVDSSGGRKSKAVSYAVFSKKQIKGLGPEQLKLLAQLRIAKKKEEKKGRSKPPQVQFKMQFDASNQRAADWAREHAGWLIDGIAQTTRERIQEAVARAQEEGDLRQQYQDILDAVGDEDRANVIARTESMTAVNEGQREAWRQAVEEGLLPEGVQRTWIATGDEGVCPICEELDGKVTDLDGEYPEPGGEGPPAHPNCRCTEGIIGYRVGAFNPDQPRDEQGQWTNGVGPKGIRNTPENRSIRWIKQAGHYVNAEPITLYHGTTESRASLIELEGLRYGNLATTPEYAAQIAAIRREGESPVVFEVQAPAGSIHPVFGGPKRLQTDALSLARTIKSVKRLKTKGL